MKSAAARRRSCPISPERSDQRQPAGAAFLTIGASALVSARRGCGHKERAASLPRAFCRRENQRSRPRPDRADCRVPNRCAMRPAEFYSRTPLIGFVAKSNSIYLRPWHFRIGLSTSVTNRNNYRFLVQMQTRHASAAWLPYRKLKQVRRFPAGPMLTPFGSSVLRRHAAVRYRVSLRGRPGYGRHARLGGSPARTSATVRPPELTACGRRHPGPPLHRAEPHPRLN